MNNGRARLRRVIKSLAAPAEPTIDIQEQIKEEADAVQFSEALELAVPVSMNKARRREIAARYLEVESVRDIMEEFDLFYDEAVRAIKLAGGAAARKVKEEIALRIQIEKAVDNINQGKPVVLPKKVEKVLKAMKEEEEVQDTMETEPAAKPARTTWRNNVPKTYAEKFPGTIIHENADGFSIDIPCTGCGETHKAAYTAPAVEPPYKVLKALRDDGWLIGETTQRYSCPKHGAGRLHKPKKEQATFAAQSSDLGTVSEVPPAPVVQEAPPPAKRAANIRAARRAVILWLDEFFDLKHNCYKAGMNDAQIANEVGLHEVEVSAIREDLYGPIGPPEEFVEMLAKIDQIEDDIKSMSEAFTQQVVSMMKEAQTLRSEFEQRAKANGWVE